MGSDHHKTSWILLRSGNRGLEAFIRWHSFTYHACEEAVRYYHLSLGILDIPLKVEDSIADIVEEGTVDGRDTTLKERVGVDAVI